jgi:hypothetical protein
VATDIMMIKACYHHNYIPACTVVNGGAIYSERHLFGYQCDISIIAKDGRSGKGGKQECDDQKL